MEDVGRVITLDGDVRKDVNVIGEFPAIFIQMSDDERNRFAGHALRMFQSFLELPKVVRIATKSTSSLSEGLSARLVGLAYYLVKFHPGPRRSVATQTGSD